MVARSLAALVALAVILHTPLRVAGQTGNPPAAQSTPSATKSSSDTNAASPVPQANPASSANSAAPADYEPSHITIATPSPAPAPWPWQERVAWGANLVLVILVYVGIMMGLSTLRKIQQQAAYTEESAQAASQTAQAALLDAMALARAERPWVLVTVEPSREKENAFIIVATNRGRSPARVVQSMHEMARAADETMLPKSPELRRSKDDMPANSIILLPGESTSLLTFSREEAAAFSESEQRMKELEEWEAKIYLYGKVIYSDLIARTDAEQHETGWCFWYIHGRQKSGMVAAGTPAYNAHT